MQIDNWDDLRFVLAMARRGTMSAAARDLSTNVATVSRRLDRLTRELRVPLFEKRGTGYVATRAADSLARLAEGLEQALRAGIADIRAEQGSMEVALEISAPPGVHRRFLLPRTDELAARLPHLTLTLRDKARSMGLGGADIEIRAGRPEGGRLKARKFRDYAMRVFHRADRPLDDAWIGLAHCLSDAIPLHLLHPDAARLPRYRVDSLPLALEMAQKTGCAVLLPDFMVEPAHGLVAADLPENAVPGELWIAYHETRHGDPTLRAVVDWYCEAV